MDQTGIELTASQLRHGSIAVERLVETLDKFDTKTMTRKSATAIINASKIVIAHHSETLGMLAPAYTGLCESVRKGEVMINAMMSAVSELSAEYPGLYQRWDALVAAKLKQSAQQ